MPMSRSISTPSSTRPSEWKITGIPACLAGSTIRSKCGRHWRANLRGSTNIHDELTQHTPIWDAWADEDGELGPIYGYQWRHWGGRGDDPGIAKRSASAGGGAPDGDAGGAGELPRGIDQIAEAIALIKRDPTLRRIIVSAWNVADLPKMKLPPCHAFFQFYVQGSHLDCQLYQRSADLALGVPFNIASYALLTAMIAKECGLQPRFFIHTLGDAHIYLNHVEGVQLQLAREPLPLPRLVLADKPVLAQRFEDIVLHDGERTNHVVVIRNRGRDRPDLRDALDPLRSLKKPAWRVGMALLTTTVADRTARFTT